MKSAINMSDTFEQINFDPIPYQIGDNLTFICSAFPIGHSEVLFLNTVINDFNASFDFSNPSNFTFSDVQSGTTFFVQPFYI